ncbi:MAG TPA: hypothetical protein VMV72_05330 [Verrucomicrobiae bacterium]|nr:hypothetical protein [Verrucomicrobiae bacterium]
MYIEIDFEVFKALTAMRETEQTTHNDILRRMLNLSPPTHPTVPRPDVTGRSFIAEGVEFPHGTEFRMRHKGRWFTARVSDGALVCDGKGYASVSKPACEITRTSVNGWKHWECRLPGHADWQSIDTLRHRACLAEASA